jgi:gamma-glutamylcyclotransferase (GGCT)/AIG2-like uncharacterized protein YtfP
VHGHDALPRDIAETGGEKRGLATPVHEYIFVYGTLLPQYAPEDLQSAVHALRYVGDGMVYGWLYDMGDFPALVLHPDAPDAFGTVFALPTEGHVLARFDKYEEFYSDNVAASLFVRQATTVTLTDGSLLTCWIYVYNRVIGGATLISSGNYVAYKSVK